jgi:hypothetical protein
MKGWNAPCMKISWEACKTRAFTQLGTDWEEIRVSPLDLGTVYTWVYLIIISFSILKEYTWKEINKVGFRLLLVSTKQHTIHVIEIFSLKYSPLFGFLNW